MSLSQLFDKKLAEASKEPDPLEIGVGPPCGLADFKGRHAVNSSSLEIRHQWKKLDERLKKYREET